VTRGQIILTVSQECPTKQGTRPELDRTARTGPK